MSNTVNRSNPISPKISWPTILLALANGLQVAATQEWTEANTYAAATTVLFAIVGFIVSDPKRVTNQ
jgi:hypothetical protein